jgi:hypothetical protein
MAAPFPRPPTTRSRGHRLPSSSDEEEQEDLRPRKVARRSRQAVGENEQSDDDEEQRDPDEDVEEHDNVAPAGHGRAVNPAQLSQLLQVVQDADAEEMEGARQGHDGESVSGDGSQSSEEDGSEEEDSSGEEEADENAEEENNNKDNDKSKPNSPPRPPRRASPPPRIGHRVDKTHIARLQATILQPLPSTATGADFSNASNLGYGGRSRAGILVRTRRWSEEVGYATFGDGYDSDGNPIIESDSEDEQGPDPSQPPVESNATTPPDPWAGDSAYEDAMLDTPSRGRAADMGMEERTPFGSQGSQYVGYLRDGLDPEGADWPDYSPPRRQSQVPSRSHTPGPTDMGEESPYRQTFGFDGAEDGSSDGGEEDGGESGGEETSDEDGGQVGGDAEDGDGRGAGEQSGDEVGSQYSEPAAGGAEIDGDAEGGDGDSSDDEQAQAQPLTGRRGPVILTPARGLPNQEYAGRITRRMAAAQRAYNNPLAPGQGYPPVPIAESQAAQILLGQFGGEPDSEDDEDSEDDGDEDNEDGSSEDEDGEVE